MPAIPAIDEPIAERPEEPDTLTPDGPQQPGPARARSPAQTNIERADERKTGSVETVPDADASSAVVGFVEPTSDAPADSQLPRGLESE